MPQLDLSVFFSQSLNFINYFIFIFTCSFIATPITMGLLKSRNLALKKNNG